MELEGESNEHVVDVLAQQKHGADCDDGLDSITYRVDKTDFIVTPVYRECADRTIGEILVSLMEVDDWI